MALTAAQRLVEAEAAYHALMTGTAVVEVRDSSGESVRYTVANAGRLKTYITEIKLEVAGTTVRSGPMRPVWG